MIDQGVNMEVKVVEKKQGAANDVMNEPGFEIHDLMFTNHDLIQCLMLCSSSCVESIFNPFVNALMITIDRKEKHIICAPMTFNKTYSRKLKKDDGDVKVNTYIQENDNKTLLLLSTGFIMDNFELVQGVHDFLIDEDQPFVYLEASDIESLTVKDPLIV